jgi:Rne/Rng family ribonuclease
MSKELFVSSTPHETKVGLVEDDLLAEVYLERENEYTLAGSIYKGRVTRVLPGMQSAFVDIGLERDAFLYVSDFMEMEEGDDVDDVPTGRATNGAPPDQRNGQEARPREHSGGRERFSRPTTQQTSEPIEGEASPGSVDAAGLPSEGNRSSEPRDRGAYRGRRRRRGRGGEHSSESRPIRTATAPVEETARPERSEPVERVERPARQSFGPPAGYQPMVLPGESISKYSRMSGAASAPARAHQVEDSPTQAKSETPTVTEKFADDEPLFAMTPSSQQNDNTEPQQASHAPEIGSADWDREQRRQHEANVAAVFGQTESSREHESHEAMIVSSAMVEEEIDDEEAELSEYTDEMEEDAPLEDMEEEIRAADEFDETESESDHHNHDENETSDQLVEGHDHHDENHHEVELFVDHEVSHEEGDQHLAEALGEHEHEEEEADTEIDDAQAQAEAILEAEARGDGTVDASAEVRAPAAAVPYTQRPQRQGFDRGRGGRGRRGSGRRFQPRAQQNVPLISDLLKEGQEILVQIAKEPIGKKGARITSHIALPGRFLVYMPTVNHTGVSRKISSEEERQRLKRIIISERENGTGGFIVRTAAQGADEEELRADIRFLKGLWNEIKTRDENGKGPTLIYHDLNVVERILRDQVTSDFSTIWVDTEQEYERILRFANRFQPALVRKIKFYTKETPLFEQFGLSEEINKALKSKVWLKSGGYIVINQTEALVAIDINTGKYVGKTARLEDTIVKTNVDAIKEIVRQIRLRDLGGIIIIDFIDMDERRNRQRVMQALEEALRSDRAPSKVLQFNDFGLVAITRKRVKQSLERTIGSPCPYCDSTGYVKSVATVCNDIYIEMRKMAKHLDHADAMLRVNPEVAKALKANNGKMLLEMEELAKKTVIVKSDPALHQEQFDIN